MKIRSLANAAVCALVLFSMTISGIAQTSQASQTLPKGVTMGASVEGITEYKLDNGLSVLLFPDQTKSTITVNITYMVGSRHENYGETGMAHLLEHLVFKGTPNHPNIPKELTERGAAPNGTTWFDRTNYFETFAANDENLDWALDLEADRMINSYIAKKDLESEFSVVRNELESGENSPFRVTMQRMMSAAFDWHNYGKSTIGARTDIENVPIENLQGFYKKFYQPDNAVLMVAGKFDTAKTLDLISKKFGTIPKPTRKLPTIYTVEPTQDGERLVTIRRTGDTQLLMSGYRIPSGSHADSGAITVLTQVLGDSPSGRLYKSLVESKKATSVGANDFQLHDPGYLFFLAEMNKETAIDDTKKTLAETVETFGKTAPTKEEVDRAKTQLLKSIDMTLNDPNRVGLGLSEFIALGDWRLFFIQRDRIKAVTEADVQRVAQSYLKQSNRTTAQFIPTATPDRAEIPLISRDEVAKLVNAYKGGEAVAAGEAFDASPANIDTRTKISKIGDLKVALLEKENRGDTVFGSMRFRFGDEKSLMKRSTAADFTGQMLMRGTKNKTRQQIQDEVDRLKARLNVSGNASGISVSFETTRQNLTDVIKLVNEIVKEPTFPENEWEILKSESLTGIESSKNEPTQIAITAMQKHFNKYPKGDVRYFNTPDEDIAEITATTLNDVKAFYKDFYGTSVGEVAVIGDFDGTALADQIKTSFSTWKSPKPYTRVASQFFDIPAANETFETPDKANAFFIARLNIKMNNDNPDYAALSVASSIIGGGFLNSRLATRIRQKDGLSYSVGANTQVGAPDENAAFIANAIYAPQNREKLEAAFKEEIQRVVDEGFTEEELTSAKQGFLLAQQRNRAQDASLANMWVGYLNLGRTFKWAGDLDTKIQALTLNDVNAAVKKHITPAKISIFKAGDFAKPVAK